MRGLPSLMVITPISASVEDAVATQVCYPDVTVSIKFSGFPACQQFNMRKEKKSAEPELIDDQPLQCYREGEPDSLDVTLSSCVGVATYCKDNATPLAAEEGLTGLLPNNAGDIGCYGNLSEFTDEELQLLDNEGRAIITQHRVQ